MTSATQSNSGCSAYIGFLYALLGGPEVITSEELAELTHARVFDGRENLVEAFRSVKGYN